MSCGIRRFRVRVGLSDVKTWEFRRLVTYVQGNCSGYNTAGEWNETMQQPSWLLLSFTPFLVWSCPFLHDHPCKIEGSTEET